MRVASKRQQRPQHLETQSRGFRLYGQIKGRMPSALRPSLVRIDGNKACLACNAIGSTLGLDLKEQNPAEESEPLASGTRMPCLSSILFRNTSDSRLQPLAWKPFISFLCGAPSATSCENLWATFAGVHSGGGFMGYLYGGLAVSLV